MAVINPFERPSISPLLGVNPLEGAMMGANIPYAQQSGLQTLQSQDINNMSELEKLRMMKESTNPTLEAENTLKRTTAEQGMNPDVLAAALEEKLAGSREKTIGSNAKVQLAQAEFMQELGNEIKNRAEGGKEPFDPYKQEDHDWWDQQKERAKGLGIKAFPNKPTTEFMAQLAFKTNDVKFNQKMAGLKVQVDAQVKGHEVSAGATKYAADVGAASRENVATTGAEAKKAVADARLEQQSTLMSYFIREARAGRAIDPELAHQAGQNAFVNEADKTALGLDALKLYAAGKNEEASAKKEQWIQNWIDKNIPKPKGSPETKVAPATSAPAAKTPGKPKVVNTTAEYNALPSGADYVDSAGVPGKKK